MEEDLKKRPGPTFRRWDCIPNFPITQYFESFRHDHRDLFELPAQAKPAHHYQHQKLKGGRWEKEQSQWMARNYPMYVDEELYKVSPKLLQKPKQL